MRTALALITGMVTGGAMALDEIQAHGLVTFQVVLMVILFMYLVNS